MSSMDDLFKKAVKQRKEEKKKEDQGGTFSQDREMPEYTALETNGFKLVRMLGEPIAMRTKPTSPKIIYHTFILGDDDKKFRCIFPSKQEKPNWILWKVMNKVLSYTWDPNAGENGARVYHNKDSHPTLFNRVAKNNKENNPFETGWRPSGFVVQNVIDRDPSVYKWHKDNKKTVLLSKKGREMQDGGIFYEPGFPPTLYNTILEDVVEVNGDPNTYDVIVQKLNDKPFYKAFHPVEDYKKLLAKFDGEETQLKEGIPGFDRDIVEEPLTDEELSWELYDLDKYFPVTSYKKIQNRLNIFLESVDKAFGTKFVEELNDLVAEEKKEWDAQGKNLDGKEESTKTTVTKEKEVSKEETTEEKKKEPVKRRRPQKEESNTEEFSVEKILNEHSELEGASHLTPEMKAMIKDVEYNSNGTIQNFKYDTDEDVLECINADEGCTMTSPESFTHCPLCGVSFD